MANVLYRMFDAEDRLLYVGISSNPGRRVKQHLKEKDWWENIVRLTLEHFPDRKALAKAEKQAIQKERPLYNKVHNGSSFRGHSPTFSSAIFPRVRESEVIGKLFLTKWCESGSFRYDSRWEFDPDSDHLVAGRVIGRAASRDVPLMYVSATPIDEPEDVSLVVDGEIEAHRIELFTVPLWEMTNWEFINDYEVKGSA